MLFIAIYFSRRVPVREVCFWHTVVDESLPDPPRDSDDVRLPSFKKLSIALKKCQQIDVLFTVSAKNHSCFYSNIKTLRDDLDASEGT